MKYSFGQLFWDQLTERVPPVIEKDLEGKTVIITGANTGIGLEAAKHFARMNAGKIIIACRDESRGEAAVQKIKHETGHKNTELWILDLSKFDSVKAFADRYEKEGGRLDILVENAAIAAPIRGGLEVSGDGWEVSFQVNYLSTGLLALLLLPRMLETAERYRTTPRITIVSSDVHYYTQFKTDDVLNGENFLHRFGKSEEYYKARNRYRDTKLFDVFLTRALSERLAGKRVIVNCVNPGFCTSELRRNIKGPIAFISWLIELVIARTAEQGSRQLMWAAVAEPDSDNDLRGAYVSEMQVKEASDFVIDEEGHKIEDKLWDLLIDELVKVDGRVSGIVKSCLTF